MNITLAAFGKRGYFYAAYNLAFAIKHFDKDAKILLIHDKGINSLPPSELAIFDNLHQVDENVTHPLGLFDAGNVKLNVYRIATTYFKEYLFLDVDGIVLKSIKPWYDACVKNTGDFFTDVRGSGGIEDAINYSVWAKNEDIYSEFGLDKDDTWKAIQSSWHFAKKTKDNSAMFKDAVKLNLTTFKDRKVLLIKWGRCLPDELVLGGAIARRKLDPSVDFTPIFFPNPQKPIQEVRDNYYLLSMFGNGKGHTMVKVDFKEFYDKFLLKEVFKPNGMNFKYKNSMIMRDKMIG